MGKWFVCWEVKLPDGKKAKGRHTGCDQKYIAENACKAFKAKYADIEFIKHFVGKGHK